MDRKSHNFHTCRVRPLCGDPSEFRKVIKSLKTIWNYIILTICVAVLASYRSVTDTDRRTNFLYLRVLAYM